MVKLDTVEYCNRRNAMSKIKHLRRRSIVSILLLVLIIGAMSMTVSAADDIVQHTLENDSGILTFNKTTKTVTGYTPGTSTELEIPASIDGVAVEQIGYRAFYWQQSLTSVAIPSSVSTISNEAFYNSISLTNVTIPEDSALVALGDQAFDSCKALTDIFIPAGVETIGYSTFYMCESLTEISFQENSKLTSIGEFAFGRCYSLLGINLPDGLLSIDRAAFEYSGLLSLTFPSTLETIGEYAFKNTGLTTVSLPENLSYLGKSAFESCKSLESVNLPDTLTIDINSSTFAGCSSLLSINIPEGIKNIGPSAFTGCSKLSEVIIEGAISIGNSAFTYCTSLTSINIPSTVKSIGDYAFSYCNQLASVTLNEGLESIGEMAFDNCTALNNIPLPDSLTTIGQSAFYKSGYKGALTIPANVDTLGAYAFYGTKISSAEFAGNLIDKIDYGLFGNCKELVTVTLPENITSIESGAFSSNSKLESINMPDGINYIGYQAFNGCGSLTSIDLPAALTKIDRNAFYGCFSLATVNMTDAVNLEIIDSRAFYLTGITSVEIPDSVYSIGEWAFALCYSLSTVKLPTNQEYTIISGSTFFNATSLESIIIPANIREIRPSAFVGCSSLSSVDIKEGTKIIGNGAFAATNLTDITIPTTVNQLGLGVLTNKDSGAAVNMTILNRDLLLPQDPFYGDLVKNANITVYGYETNSDGGTSDLLTKASTYGYNFISLTDMAVLSLKLNDSDNNPIATGYDVIWKDQEGNVVTSGVAGSSYTYEIVLGEELGFLYQKPEIGTIENVKAGLNSVTVKLMPHTTIKLTADLSDYSGQSVTISQSIGGYAEKTTPTLDDDGKLSVDLKALDTTITINVEGYHQKVIYRSAANMTADWDLGQISFSEIPASDSLRIQLEKLQADGSRIPIGSAAGLSFELKKTTGDTPVSYTLSYPYIMIADEEAAITNNTELTLLVTADPSLKLVGGSAVSTKAGGTFVVTLKEFGHLEARPESRGPGTKIVMIFDDRGQLTERGTLAQSDEAFVSGSLASGSYKAVFIDQNSIFDNVSTLSALGRLGLIEGTDYRILDFTIEDGKIGSLEDFSIPVLDLGAERFNLLDKSASGILVTKNKVPVTSSFMTTVDFKMTIPSDREKVITINLPSGAKLTGHGTNISNLSFEEDGDILTLKTNKNSGSISLSMYLTKVGEQAISGSVTDGGISAPIGSFTLVASEMNLAINPVQNDREHIKAKLYTIPNSTVDVYLDGKLIVPDQPFKSNSLGIALLDFAMPENTLSYTKHKIALTVTPSNADAVSTVNPFTFEFIELAAEVLNLRVKNGVTSFMLDYNNVLNNPSFYRYQGGDWSFAADIRGYDVMDRNSVFVKIEMLDGSTRVVPMTYLKDPNDGKDNIATFAASIDLKADVLERSPGKIPTGFEILFSYEPYEYEVSVGNIKSEIEEGSDNALYGYSDILGRNLTPEDHTPYQKLSEMEGFESLSDSDKELVLNYEAAEEEFFRNIGGMFGIDSVLSYGEDVDLLQLMGIDIRDLTDDEAKALDLSDHNQIKNSDTPGALMYVKHQADGSSMTFVNIETGNSYICTIAPNENVLEDFGELKAPELKTKEAMKKISLAGFDLLAEEGGATSMPGFRDWVGYATAGLGELTEMANKLDDKLNVLIGPELKNRALRYDIYEKYLSGLGIVIDYEEHEEIQEKIADLAQYRERVRNKVLEALRDYLAEPTQERWNCYIALSNLSETLDDLDRLLTEKEYYTKYKLLYGSGALAMNLIPVGKAATTAEKFAKVLGHVDKVVLAVTVGADLDYNYLISSTEQRIKNHEYMAEVACEGIPDIDNNRVYVSIAPIVDPSGYVYEAVESNRLEGVEAKIYYKDGEDAVLWDAEDFSQQNPLTTDQKGLYAWDVPVGDWKVTFAKSGYENLDSLDQYHWLPVPPPQLDVNVGMVSLVSPEVISINAYEDYIEVIFSQYMDISTFEDTSISLGGETISGDDLELLFPDKEVSPTDSDKYFGRILRIGKSDYNDLTGTVKVTLKGAVNYAGKNLADYESEELSIKARPASLILNYETLILPAGEESTVKVRVKDRDGNLMKDVKVNASLDSDWYATIDATATTDADGVAIFNAKGLLPGKTAVTFTVDGTSLSKTVNVEVTVEALQAERPEVTIGKVKLDASAPKENYVKVSKGTKLTIESPTEGSVIYYTTNDTCPCQAGIGRVLYTGPITLNESVYLRIAAYKDGLLYSDRINVTITVAEEPGSLSDDPAGGDSVKIVNKTILSTEQAGEEVAASDETVIDKDISGKVDKPEASEKDESKESEEDSTGWYKYILIGAVPAAFIFFLAKKKKKKDE